MTTRFIILTDFSENAKNTLKYAYEWSLQANASLLLVHQTLVAAPALTDSLGMESIAQHANNEALEKLKVLVSENLPADANVSYSVSERHIRPVLEALLAEPFDHLVFVGLRKSNLRKKLLLGNLAVEVIDKTKDIVVAIPVEINKFSHEKIFVAVTEKHPLNILELNNFLSLIDKSDTHIKFFYLAKANEETKEIEKQLKDLAKLFSARFNTSYAIYEGENSFNDIQKVINNKVEEILVVQKGSRNLTDVLFRRFLINDLIIEGQTPLIILP